MGMNRRGNMRQQRMAAAGRMMPERMGMGGIRGSNSHYVSKTGHSVHMRGLPFQADNQDVADVSAGSPSQGSSSVCVAVLDTCQSEDSKTSTRYFLSLKLVFSSFMFAFSTINTNT